MFVSYKQCLAKARDIHGDDVQEADEDDGLQMVDDPNAGALNTHCPLSGKRVSDLFSYIPEIQLLVLAVGGAADASHRSGWIRL